MYLAATSESLSLSNVAPCRSSSRRTVWWLENDPLWTTHTPSAGTNGWQCALVTADSVAIRVWPTPWYPGAPAMPNFAHTCSAPPTSLTTFSVPVPS